MKKSIFTILLIIIVNIIPRGEVIIKKAECDICECLTAPTCVDLIMPARGFPFISSYGQHEYPHSVREEYSDGAIIWPGLIANSLSVLLSAIATNKFRGKK